MRASTVFDWRLHAVAKIAEPGIADNLAHDYSSILGKIGRRIFFEEDLLKASHTDS